ncbi:MAG: hypothetical protein WBY78_12280 [Terriglobales bacterium]
MIEIQQFENIKQKHGSYASWAVWADAAEKPKSNMGDMNVFDLASNPALLHVLKTNVIMVGLNIASVPRLRPEPFGNFHDPSPSANDFKIRYAFRDTEYYGAYMTDIIKRVGMLDSKDLLAHLKAHPALVEQNIENFREWRGRMASTRTRYLAGVGSTWEEDLGSASRHSRKSFHAEWIWSAHLHNFSAHRLAGRRLGW